MDRPLRLANSAEVSFDVHASMEDTEHIDPRLIHNDVRDSIMTIRCLANLTVRYRLVPLPESRVLTK